MTTIANLGSGGTALSAVATSVPLIAHGGVNHLALPGVAGTNFVSFPDPGVVGATSLDVRFVLSMADWTPAGNQAIMTFGTGSIGGLRVLALMSGSLYFELIDSGGTARWVQSSVAPTVADGAILAGRIQWRASDQRVQVFTKATTAAAARADMVSHSGWTQLGTNLTLPGSIAAVLPNSAVQFVVGSNGTGGNIQLAGDVYAVSLATAFDGTPVLDLDFTTNITSGSQYSLLPTTSPAAATHQPQVLGNLGTMGRLGDAYVGSSVGVDSNDPIRLAHTGTDYIYFPGSASNYLSAGEVNVMPNSDFTVKVYTNANLASTTFGAFCGNTNQISTGLRFGTGNGAPRLGISWYDSGTSSFRTVTANADNPNVSGWVYLKAALDKDNGAGECAVTFSWSSDDVSWTTIGTTVTTATVANPAYVSGAGQQFGVGSNKGDNWQNGVIGGIGRVVCWSDLTETTKTIDVDTSVISTGAETSFLATTGQTVTINRSTSGRKTVCVVRPTYSLGTDDYFEVPNAPELNFGATDSFTVMAAHRVWNTAGGNRILLSKSASLSSGLGYAMYVSTDDAWGFWADGAAFPSFARQNEYTDGGLTTTTMVRDVPLDQLSMRVGAGTPTTITDTSTLSLASPHPLRVGTYGGSTGAYLDGEFFGAAIWRRVLTPAEITTVNTAYTTNVFGAPALALLEEAVWWIDAQRSPSCAAIVRSTGAVAKTVAVTRDVWLFDGNSSFMEIADSPLLDAAAGEDLSVVFIGRTWPTQGTGDTFIGKVANTTATTQGWRLGNDPADSTLVDFTIGDGTNGPAPTTIRMPGRLQMLTGVRSVTADQVRLQRRGGTIIDVNATDTTTTGSSNSEVVRIGRLSGAGTEYWAGELVAVIVAKRPFTETELSAIATYYGVN